MKRYNKNNHTFVVCAYGESEYLETCICSVLNQNIPTNVCISTSTPNSYIKKIANKYHLDVHVNDGEKGIAGDWNYAVSCAETPLVTLAHQDDVYSDNYTKYMLRYINYTEEPLIAFSDYYELRNGNTTKNNLLLTVKRCMLLPLKIKCLWKNRWVRRRILSFGSAICCPSVTLVKENLIMPVFKNNMKSNIDWQAWEEISKSKGSFVYVDRPLVKHRIHEQSTTSELLEVDGRKEEDLFMFSKFWPAWMAKTIQELYSINEKSNKL